MDEVATWAQLGNAIAAAAQDSFRCWLRDSCGGLDAFDAHSRYFISQQINLELGIGKPVTIVAEVLDRRPGKSTLEHYVIERKGSMPRLTRGKDHPGA